MPPRNQFNTTAVFLVATLGIAALVVWLVRSEADRTRAAIGQASRQAGGEVREGIVEGVDRAADRASELPEKIIRQAADQIGELARQTDKPHNATSKPKGSRRDIRRKGSKPTSAEEETRAEIEDESAADAEPRETSASRRSSTESRDSDEENVTDSTEEMPSAAKPRDIATAAVGDLFKIGHDLSKAADDAAQEFMGLSVQEEQRRGRDVYRVCLAQLKIAKTGAARRLTTLAKPLLELRKRTEISYTFTVVEDESVNAFSHLGGYVYVHRGLLKYCKSDAELQFVLGHEIAHVDLKHCAGRALAATRAAEVAGESGAAVADLAYNAIALGYSENQEFAADAWAFRSLLAIGRTRVDATSLLRRFDADPQFSNSAEETDDPEFGRIGAAVKRQLVDHFRSHPPAAQRLQRLQDLDVGE